MSDALSVRAAAAEVPDAPAVILEDRVLTFAEVAAALPPVRERARIAAPTLDTLLVIYAALAEHAPIALLHPKLAPAELARQAAVVTAAALPADTAVVLFTSGSTAAARGVVLSRAALLANARASAARLPLTAADRWLLALSLAHSGGLSVLTRCLVARAPIVLETGASLVGRATLASLVPTQLALLLEDPAWRSPPALRAILLGGAAASPALLAAARARGVPVRTTYGLTETFGQVATALDETSAPTPLPGVTLLAGTAAAPAPIRIRGPMLATGYLDGASIAPELITADLGYLDATGALHIAGRADDVIITGGENVHPAAVEAVLATTPGVRAALAFGVADARWGQLVAVALAVADPVAFDLAAATAHWRAALPPHALPRRLALVTALPQGVTGKLDRRAAAGLPSVPVSYSRYPPRMIAFFGMGLLGSNFVRALRKRGEDVRVWNRNPARAEPLAADGATVCADPAEAARGASRIHLTLTDDAAVDEVLERARPGFAPGVTIVDHSTCAPAGVAARAARWAERGIAFQHAPVFMGPANALAGTGLMLASGDRDRFDALAPALAPMTGKLIYAGPVPERAAAWKLLGNHFLMLFTAGVTETFALAKALHVPKEEVGTLFESFNPGASLSQRVARVASGVFDDPSWELAMARKDARLMLEAADGTLAVLPALAALMDQWIAKGHAHDDWTVIGKAAVT